MKGVVFTLDAIFALAIASFAISILVYLQFYSQIPVGTSYLQTSNLFQTLSSTNISEIASSNQTAQDILGASSAQNDTWPQQYANNQNDGYANHGPMSSSTSFVFSSASGISAGPVAAYGKVFIGGSKELYALNATAGTLSWTYATGNTINNLLAQGGSIIINNGTNLIKLNANNGNVIWVSNPVGPLTKIVYYSGQVIGVGSSSTSIYTFWASNGMLSGTLSGINTGLGTIAMASGSIAFLGTGTPHLKLFDLEGSNMSKIWQTTATYTGEDSNIATYGKYVAFSTGTSNPGIYYINGTLLSSTYSAISGGGSITGIAYGDGEFVFQSTKGIEAISPTSNAVVWNVAAPAPLSNTAGFMSPSIGGGIVYSEWSNSDILAQNASNGNVLWVATTPYSLASIGGTSGFPPTNDTAIAYGKLFVTTSSGLLAIGPCPVNSNSSALLEAATLYLNGYGSCADYILNYIEPMYNYTLFINNEIAPSLIGPTFNGQTSSSYVQIPPLNALNGHTSYTISAWLKYNGGSSSFGQNPLPVAWPGCHMGFQYANGNYLDYVSWITTTQNPSPGCGGASGSYTANIIGAQVQQGKWYNAVATVDIQSETTSFYLNGIFVGSNVLPANYYYFNYSENGYFGDKVDGNTNTEFFNGMISNVQIYNASLSSSKVEQIYLGGISGPPVENSGIVAWYPLAGDANDYGGGFNTGFPLNVNWGSLNFTPQGLENAFSISRSSSVLGLENFTTGATKLYNVSVVSWR